MNRVAYLLICGVALIILAGCDIFQKNPPGPDRTSPEDNKSPTGITDLSPVWRYTVQGPDQKDEIDGVSTDSKGNTYIGGQFAKSVDFNGTVRSATSGYDVFVSRLDENGQEDWFVSLDSGGNDHQWDLTVDKNEDVILSGGYGGTMVVNGQEYAASRDGSAFWAKLDGETGEFIWFTAAGAVGETDEIVEPLRSAGGNEVKVDEDNNIASLLMASGTQIAIGEERYPGSNLKSSFVVKMSPDGEFLWSHHFEGRGDQQLRAIGLNGHNEIAFGHQLRGQIETERFGTFEGGTGDRAETIGTYGLLSPDGELLWMKRVDSDGFANIRGAGGDQAGNLYFIGQITDDTLVNNQSVTGYKKVSTLLMQVTRAGEIGWLRVLGNNKNDGAGELALHKNLISITGVNSGSDYNLYDLDGTVLAEQVFDSHSQRSRGTLAVFTIDGKLTARYEPTYSDHAMGGVTEFYDEQCLVYNTMFYGEVTYSNGDSYQTVDPMDKDAVLSKVCF